MNFEELKERIHAEWAKSIDQLEENRIYNEVKDRYENLTPVQQKLMLSGVIGFVILIMFSIPYSYYSASDETMIEFHAKRQLIRDLLKTAKEAKEGPEIPMPPPMESLKSQVDSYLKSKELLPEQMTGNSVESPQGGIVNSNLIEGILKVSVSQLNLRQIVEFGLEFSNLSPSAKLKDLQINAHPKESGYFDVVYKILVLKVKPKDLPQEDEKPKKKGKK